MFIGDHYINNIRPRRSVIEVPIMLLDKQSTCKQGEKVRNVQTLILRKFHWQVQNYHLPEDEIETKRGGDQKYSLSGSRIVNLLSLFILTPRQQKDGYSVLKSSEVMLSTHIIGN